MICHNCRKDITDGLFSQDSDVRGFIDIGYSCEDCKLDFFTFKIERMEDEEDGQE